MSNHVRRLSLVIGSLLACAVIAAVLTVRFRAESWVRAKIDERLAGSNFAITWDHLEASLLGRVSVQGLQLREGTDRLALVERIEASISLRSLWSGRLRLGEVAVVRPSLWVDVIGTKPEAWLRCREALRRHPAAEEGTARPLSERLGHLSLQGGSVHIKVLGPAVWLTGPDIEVRDIGLEADTGEGGQLSVGLPRLAGGGQLRTRFSILDGELSEASGQFEPPLTWAPPPTMSGKLPADLKVEARQVTWSPAEGAQLLDLALVDLAESPTALVRAASLGGGDGRLSLSEVRVQVPHRRLRWALEHALPQGLPEEATAVLAQLDAIHGQVGHVEAASRDGAWELQADGAGLMIGDSVAQLDHLVIRAGAKGEDGQRPTDIALQGPRLTLPRSSKLLKGARIAAALADLLAVRKVEEPEDVDDADLDDALHPELTPPRPPARAARANPGSQGKTSRNRPVERPPVRWQRQLRQAAQSALGLRKALEKRWPLHRWPAGWTLRVTEAEAHLLSESGQPLLGVRHAALALLGPNDPVQIAAEPFDVLGSWGRVGLQWRRQPGSRVHTLEIVLRGGGVAQLVASRLPGLSVGDGAELDANLTLTLADDQHLDVAARLDVQRMGIQWWRLADRPIADFALSTILEARITPTSLTLRTPELRLGDALMYGTVEALGLDGNPVIRIQLDAPMQDCGAMLASVPPSMTPTLGRIDAHGVMDWHVGLTTHLPGVGYTAVDLALGDTLCVVDHLGTLDLQEFRKPNWVRPVNENGRLLEDVLVGPGSGSWTSTMRMPGYAHYVMWATEDPFMKHRGISEDLLAKAIAIDLSTGRFTYGGSTITQQLVKNLFLKRTKALSRKFEEMLIVWQMEKTLGKARILEIYVNIVEFGPKIYGITRATWEFFQKRPAELRPKEAVFLAIIKPSPRSGWGTMRANGWGDWYEMKVGKYMDKLLADESITPQQYEADKPWKPDFNPPPRGAKAP